MALEEAIWDGGGTDTDLRTAGSWGADKTPDLDNATVAPTFATGGAQASLGAPTSVLGLKFALKNDFTVSGNAPNALFLTHGASFGSPRKTKLTLTTSQAGAIYTTDIIPVVNIAEGVTQTVRELWIDGVRLAGGTWGSSESPTEHKDDVHFAGKGVLNVRGWGLAVIVR